MTVRLLFLTAETCPTFRADVDVLFGKYLPRHGVMSDVVAGRTPGMTDVQWGGGEAVLCDMDCSPARRHARTFSHAVRTMLDRAHRSTYLAIQVRDMPIIAAFGVFVARARRMPIYYWMSYPMPEGQLALARERGLSAGLMKFLFPWLNGLAGKLLLYRFVLRRVDHVFVQSDRMKEDLVALGIDPARMTPVPMGVDMEAISSGNIAPADDARLAGKRVIVHLGTLDRPRQIELLFQALALVRIEFPEAVLVLVGDTADDVHRAWLREKAAAAGVADAVVWTGWLDIRQAWRYVKSAEVALSPFPRGPLLDSASPTKVPEYLALGIPVVCNDNPDQAAIIRDSGAGLCVPYAPQDFARALTAILRRERQFDGDRGTRYVADHRSYAQIAGRLADTYSRLERGRS